MPQQNRIGWARGVFIGLLSLSLIVAIILGYLRGLNTSKNMAAINHHDGAMNIHVLPTESGAQKWKLTFDEEFNGTILDMNKWNIENYAPGGYFNCCLSYGTQYFTPNALSLQNGYLDIETARQTIGKYKYTSGAITTENKFSFLYGRVDIRAKLPKSQAFWPALWLLPDGTTSKGALFEIDIMELLGRDPTTVYLANHWNVTHQTSVAFTGPDFSQGYHVFSIIWTSQAITWYIDGIQRAQTSQEVSNKSMYLLINSTLGGHFAGYPDASTVLPQHMDLDYVRVYQQVS
jgi:beta-glucanase (GH16 family)